MPFPVPLEPEVMVIQLLLSLAVQLQSLAGGVTLMLPDPATALKVLPGGEICVGVQLTPS